MVIAIISVVFFGSMLSLYLLKLLTHPRKVVKEWHSPAHRPGFSAVTITILLYAYLALYEVSVSPSEGRCALCSASGSPCWLARVRARVGVCVGVRQDRTFAKVLFWIAGPLQLYLAVASISDW